MWFGLYLMVRYEVLVMVVVSGWVFFILLSFVVSI